jgi:LysM repeat protein
MKNQDNRTARKNRKRNTWSKLFARSPRVSAHLTQEHDWETDVPNIKLSRAFVIVLAIHVVAVGGIIGFELMQPNATTLADSGAGPEGEPVGDATPVVPEMASAPQVEVAAAPAPATPAPLPSGPSLKHIVSAGDSVRSILDRYGVTRGDLATASGFPLAATQEPFQGQVLTVHNARRGTASIDGSMPVMATERPRTIPTVPMTHIVDASEPKVDYTADNDPLLDSMPEPVALESAEGSPADDFTPLGDDPEYTLIDETTEIESPSPAPTPKATQTAPTAPTRNEVVSPKVVAKAPAASGSSHTVKAGDTAYAIGRKYGVSADSLLKANGVSDPSALRIGTVLRIPR